MAQRTNQEKLGEMDDLFDFILRVQEKFTPRVLTKEEMKTGEGRRAAIVVRGEDKWVKIFEVSQGVLVPKDSLDGIRSVIAFEGVDIFRNVCQSLLDGNTTAFSRARARGDLKVAGDYAVRDFAVFNRLFANIGKILGKYGVNLGGE